MTKLLVDAGNTKIKGVLYEEGDFQRVFTLASKDFQKQDLTIDRGRGDLTNILVCSVLGSKLTSDLVRKLTKEFSLKPSVLTTECRTDLINHTYRDITKLGVDRWMAMIGARAASPDNNIMVFDFGTAITLDIISKSGKHLGGHIVPNIESTVNGLLGATKNIQIGPARHYAGQELFKLGQSTESCVLFGIESMIYAYIKRMVEDFGSQAQDYKVYCCGEGVNKAMLDEIVQNIVYDKDLLFKGMLKCIERQES